MAIDLQFQGNDDRALNELAALANLQVPDDLNTENRIRALATAANVDLSAYAESDRNLIERLAALLGDSCPATLIYEELTEGFDALPWESWQADPPKAEMKPATAAGFGNSYYLAPVGADVGCHALDLSTPVMFECIVRAPAGGDYVSASGIGCSIGASLFVEMDLGGQVGIFPIPLFRARRHSGDQNKLAIMLGTGYAESGLIDAADYDGKNVIIGVCIDRANSRVGVIINGADIEWRTIPELASDIALPCIVVNGLMDGTNELIGENFSLQLRRYAVEFETQFPVAGKDLAGNNVA